MKTFRVVANLVFAFGCRLRKGEIVEGDRWAALGDAVQEIQKPEPVLGFPLLSVMLDEATTPAVAPEPEPESEPVVDSPVIFTVPQIEAGVPSDLDGTADKAEAPKAKSKKAKRK